MSTKVSVGESGPPPSDFPLHLARPYLVPVPSFPSPLLASFVDIYSPTLLLLGDGVFVDAHALRRTLGDGLKVQRVLNEYQFAETVIEDFNPLDLSLFAIFRLSEFGSWREDVLLNAEKAMESHCRASGNPIVLALIVDEERIPDRILKIFRWKFIPPATAASERASLNRHPSLNDF